MDQSFSVIFVGTGFASTFFLSAYLERARATDRILVLERGQLDTHAWRMQHRQYASTAPEATFVNATPAKQWYYTPAFGGGSNSWWAITPRLMPNDFRMRSVYGVGVDWPLTYDDLEDFYDRVEAAMAVSGPDDGSPFPRRRPYPQPPHRFTAPDRLIKAAYPELYFQQATARPRRPTANRPACCASGVCDLCPIDSKFTILNEMSALFRDPRVTLRLGAAVQTVETVGATATAVTYLKGGQVHRANADLVVLGANALFNPHILMRSDLHHPLLGKYLHEQVSVSVVADLNGVDNYQGSTSITGSGYMFYEGSHRSERAACLLESLNVPYLRPERGKWRQRMVMKFTFEDLPSERSFVTVNAADPALPETVFSGYSDYARRAVARVPEMASRLLATLPVERIFNPGKPKATAFHVQGTTRMGDDPTTSIVDRHLVHHRVRNLVVLGSGAFPTCSPTNPTLTLSALSLWSAAHVLGS